MSINTASATPVAPIVPAPAFHYQGAYLSLLQVDLQLGPFQFKTHPGLGFGHSVASEIVDGVPVTTLRPSPAPGGAVGSDAETSLVAMGYAQDGVEWQMAFSIVTDPKGGLIDTDFALEVESNYPAIPMSIARTPIRQPKFGVLTTGMLPSNYRASLKLRFWDRGRTDLPLDGWLAVQVGYYRDGDRASLAKAGKTGLESIPLVTTHELLYYPAHATAASNVLGGNQPVRDRHLRKAAAAG